MAQSAIRIVIDTNTLLRGLVVESSAAVKVLRAAERRRVVPLLSKAVLGEYRAVLSDKVLTERFSSLNAELVEVTLRRLRYVGDFVRVSNVTFEYRRDPRDQKFIELAIALRASHIVSSDKDLLSLPEEASDAGRRFRQRLAGVEVLEAGDLVKKYLDITQLDNVRGTTNIRDVIAFPKTQSGGDLMCGSPSPVDEKQLKEVHVRVIQPPVKT